MLRPLLEKLSDHPDATALRQRGGRAFVSLSLRPALVAALADRDPDRPTLVVAGDDRHARELAADCASGCAADGALLPEPRRHLRVAPDAAAAPDRPARRRAGRAGRGQRPVVVVSAVALVGEGPRPVAAPAQPEDHQGRPARPRRARRRPRGRRLRARRAGRGPRPVRHARRHRRPLPGHRGARGPRRALRHRGRVAALVLHLHAALAGRHGRGRDRAGRRAAPSTARQPRRRRRRHRSCRSTPSASSSTSSRTPRRS